MAETETKTRKPRKKRVDPNETPRNRWERLVRPRAQRLIDTVKLLENLRGSVYDWDHELERELFEQCEAALEGLRQKWELEDEEDPKPEVSENPVVEVEQTETAEKKSTEEKKTKVSAGKSENSDLEW